MKKLFLLITLLFVINTLSAQSALKILKDDGSITYINASAVNTITFVTPLAIGDTHEGGVIFYLDASGEHGLVAASSDQSTGIQWNNGTNTTTGATGDAVGAGEENTYKIVGNQGSASYAAQLCSDLTLNGYTDWYLPSKYELYLMYQQKANLSGIFYGSYWSSTEYNQNEAYRVSLVSGESFHAGKDYDTYHVRAIRAF